MLMDLIEDAYENSMTERKTRREYSMLKGRRIGSFHWNQVEMIEIMIDCSSCDYSMILSFCFEPA